jgi:hypothetical protein
MIDALLVPLSKPDANLAKPGEKPANGDIKAEPEAEGSGNISLPSPVEDGTPESAETAAPEAPPQPEVPKAGQESKPAKKARKAKGGGNDE